MKNKYYFNDFNFNKKKNKLENICKKLFNKWYDENFRALNKYVNYKNASSISKIVIYFYTEIYDTKLLLEYMKTITFLFIIDDLGEKDNKYILNYISIINNDTKNKDNFLDSEFIKLIYNNYMYISNIVQDDVYSITCLTNDLYSLKKEIKECIKYTENIIYKLINESDINNFSFLGSLLNDKEYLLYKDLIQGHTWWSYNNIRF